jgi:hypothetical protein
MTTQQQAKAIHEAIRQHGTQNDHRATTEWKQAFDLYRQTTGEDLSMTCRGCYHKVYQWLIKQVNQS